MASIYQHFRNKKLYKVLCVARKEVNPKNIVVIYKQLYKSKCGKFPYGTIWSRDISSFNQIVVDEDGNAVKRFVKIKKTSKEF